MKIYLSSQGKTAPCIELCPSVFQPCETLRDVGAEVRDGFHHLVSIENTDGAFNHCGHCVPQNVFTRFKGHTHRSHSDVTTAVEMIASRSFAVSLQTDFTLRA
jgi:hypothetical protein